MAYVYKDGKIISSDPYMGKKDSSYIVTEPSVLLFVKKIGEYLTGKQFNDKTVTKVITILCLYKHINVNGYNNMDPESDGNKSFSEFVGRLEDTFGSKERAKVHAKEIVGIAKEIAKATADAYVFNPDE